MEHWWQTDEMKGYIQDALIHINAAQVMGINDVERCKRLFDALNKLWSGHNQAHFDLHRHYYEPDPDQYPSDNKSLIALIKNIQASYRKQLANSEELRLLIELDPKISDHDVLRRRGYRPGQPITTTLLRDASEAHKKLSNAYTRFTADETDESQATLLKKMAELIYIVRSNIAHGEKTPYGPDTEKTKRDGQVCTTLAPLLFLIVNCVLDRPDCKFVVYGTLAPGQPNHSIIEKLQGDWRDCFITGKIDKADGLRHFVWNPYDSGIEAQLLTSSSLPQAWLEIDRFEGTNYNRILIPVKVTEGWTVAYVYQ